MACLCVHGLGGLGTGHWIASVVCVVKALYVCVVFRVLDACRYKSLGDLLVFFHVETTLVFCISLYLTLPCSAKLSKLFVLFALFSF